MFFFFSQSKKKKADLRGKFGRSRNQIDESSRYFKFAFQSLSFSLSFRWKSSPFGTRSDRVSNLPLLNPNPSCLNYLFEIQILLALRHPHRATMATTIVSSAGGLLAMLNESHPLLKLHALSNLNNLVDNFWPEISTSVPVMYAFSFASQCVCLFVSQVVFCD